jgi:hypothetical protein
MDERQTPAERTLQAKQAAHASWAKCDDRAARTKAARTGFDARFLKQVDPTGILPAAERERRAASAKKAYFLGLALRSARARRLRAAGK